MYRRLWIFTNQVMNVHGTEKKKHNVLVKVDDTDESQKTNGSILRG